MTVEGTNFRRNYTMISAEELTFVRDKLFGRNSLTREGLYRTLSKDGNPSFSAILKVMKALGLKLKPKAA